MKSRAVFSAENSSFPVTRASACSPETGIIPIMPSALGIRSARIKKAANTARANISKTAFSFTGNVVFTGNYESYELIEDSPAKGYGTDGKDCGIFGGLYPYVKGGLPQGHPYYTKAVISPRAENDKVNVSLKIKMQDE